LEKEGTFYKKKRKRTKGNVGLSSLTYQSNSLVLIRSEGVPAARRKGGLRMLPSAGEGFGNGGDKRDPLRPDSLSRGSGEGVSEGKRGGSKSGCSEKPGEVGRRGKKTAHPCGIAFHRAYKNLENITGNTSGEEILVRGGEG